jgi:hypothetical protein
MPMIDTVAPSRTGVSRPCWKRTSSSSTKTLTKRRISRVVEQALADAGVGGVEVGEDLADGVAVDLDGGARRSALRSGVGMRTVAVTEAS